MGLVTRGVGAGVLRTGQATGVVRARTLVYQQRFGQEVPYASKSWMLTQILENEFISGARGVRRPIGREFIPDENVYRPAILTRDPGVCWRTTRWNGGFFHDNLVVNIPNPLVVISSKPAH